MNTSLWTVASGSAKLTVCAITPGKQRKSKRKIVRGFTFVRSLDTKVMFMLSQFYNWTKFIMKVSKKKEVLEFEHREDAVKEADQESDHGHDDDCRHQCDYQRDNRRDEFNH